MDGQKTCTVQQLRSRLALVTARTEISFIEKPPQTPFRDPFEIVNEDAKPSIASVRTWDGRAVSGFLPLVGRLQSIAPHWGRFLFTRESFPSGHTFVCCTGGNWPSSPRNHFSGPAKPS
jgi:hypothetical protein